MRVEISHTFVYVDDLKYEIKGSRRYKGKEVNFQKAVAKYLDARKCLWFHVRNESNYNRNRRAEGVKRGVSDVAIMQPYKDKHGLFIELKVQYNKPSDEQIEFMTKARKRGYGAYWLNSWDDFEALIHECYA